MVVVSKIGHLSPPESFGFRGTPLSFLTGVRKPKKVSRKYTSVAPINTTPTRYPNSSRKRKKERKLQVKGHNTKPKWKTEKYAMLPPCTRNFFRFSGNPPWTPLRTRKTADALGIGVKGVTWRMPSLKIGRSTGCCGVTPPLLHARAGGGKGPK